MVTTSSSFYLECCVCVKVPGWGPPHRVLDAFGRLELRHYMELQKCIAPCQCLRTFAEGLCAGRVLLEMVSTSRACGHRGERDCLCAFVAWILLSMTYHV